MVVVSHLHGAIVEPKERLGKLDDRATMRFFVGYKYDGGCYRVWDPKRRVVVESRNIIFFVDGLLSPTLNDLPPRPVDEDGSTAQLVLDHSIKPTTPPHATNAPALSPLSAATPTALPEVKQQLVSVPTPHTCITMRLPGRGMNRPAAPLRELRKTSTRMRRTRTRTTDPTKMPTHLRVLSTTYHVILQSRRAQASFAMKEGLEMALCSSWMKQRILLSLFRPVYQVVFSFRSCPTRVV